MVRWGAAAVFIIALVQADKDDEGLLGRWRFEAAHLKEGAFKALAGPLDATVTGPVEFASGNPKGLVFGALTPGDKPRSQGQGKGSTYLSLPSTIPQPSLPVRLITVEAVVRVDKPVKWGGIAGLIQDNGDYEKGWLLGYNETQFLFAVAGEKGNKRLSYMAARRAYQPGAWYHVVGTYDGAEMRLYVDGRLEASEKTQKGDIAYPPKGFYTIGAYRDDDELYPMTGQILEVGVWGRVLSAGEVAQRFDARKIAVPDLQAVRPSVVDWPCFLRDNQRTGMADAAPALPLSLRWSRRERLAPEPAWPPEAKQDFWNNKPTLKQRVTFDRAFQVVSVGDLACYGSSADDRVVGVDVATGKTRWTFFAEGPVRLAPTISEGRVLFGSDDGFVYCLSAVDGSLQWKLRVGPSDRRIAGNGRIISAWPVRTDVLVEEGTAHACAGIFPGEGVFHAAIDLKTGRKLGEAAAEVSPQGYMEQRAGRLFVSTGRDPAGAFVSSLKRTGKSYGAEIASIPAEYPYGFIGAGDVRFGGGDGKVAAFASQDGRELWSAKVEGRAYSLAVAQGRLLVGTDRGRLYCFGTGEDGPATHEPPAAVEMSGAVPKDVPRKGYALVLGNPEMAVGLARGSQMKIVLAENGATSRMRIEAAGLYGNVVVHDVKPGGPLPYVEGLFNFVTGGGSREEMMRVLRPGGVAMIDGTAVRRGPIDGAGEWTHMYADAANTACSDDRALAGPMRLQWYGLPGPESLIDRHHRTVPPLSKDGRLFVPGNDRIFAVDAYNGTPLWEYAAPDSRRIAAYRDCGNMVAADDSLFIAAADQCIRLDASTGKELRKIPAPRGEWGYLAATGDLLLGSTVSQGASRREISRRIVAAETYWDFVPSVCSETLFALDRATGDARWIHMPKGPIVNSTIAIGGGRVYFVEGGAAAKDGRAKLSEILPKAEVVALDLKTGMQVWRGAPDLSMIQHVLYAVYSKEKLALVGSRNNGKEKSATVWYDLHALDAATGLSLWSQSQDQKVAINGEHGEQDHHPVIVGDRIYCEPCVYELMTGKRIEDWGWKPRRGCGTMSASASSLFFRDNSATMFDLAGRKLSKITTVTRPGCFINMIPAGGLLLIPEASSGCSCDYAVQASLGFMPAGKK